MGEVFQGGNKGSAGEASSARFCARQFMFSLSALFLMSHFFTVSQSTGRCASSRHSQQNVAPAARAEQWRK